MSMVHLNVSGVCVIFNASIYIMPSCVQQRVSHVSVNTVKSIPGAAPDRLTHDHAHLKLCKRNS